MIDINNLIRENIKSLEPYVAARHEFNGSDVVFLDANENPFGIYNRYPDPAQKILKHAIALIKQVREENIFLGNGSDEAIDLVYRIFCRPGLDKALQFTPTYGMYQVAAAINDVEMISLPLTDKFQIDTERLKPFLADKSLKLIFICSPNNPTGNALDQKDILFILQNFKGIVIIDEAYIDYSASKSFKEYIHKFNNLIVLQTFSKAWGMAAARLGMAFAQKGITDILNKVKPPYNISELNQQAVLKRLNEYALVRQEIAVTLNQRNILFAELQKISIVKKVYASNANFLLVEVNNADKVYKQLLDAKLVVRNRSSVVRNCIRITIGTRAENLQFLNALKTIANG